MAEFTSIKQHITKMEIAYRTKYNTTQKLDLPFQMYPFLKKMITAVFFVKGMFDLNRQFISLSRVSKVIRGLGVGFCGVCNMSFCFFYVLHYTLIDVN